MRLFGRDPRPDMSWGDRVKEAFVPVLFVAALYYVVFGGEYSVFDVRSSRADLEVEREILTAVQADIDSLAAWADSLENDPVTIERIARERFGMIREGETLYRFVPEPEGADEPAEPVR